MRAIGLRNFIVEHIRTGETPDVTEFASHWSEHNGHMRTTNYCCQPGGAEAWPALVTQMLELCSSDKATRFPATLNDAVGIPVGFLLLDKIQWDRAVQVHAAHSDAMRKDGLGRVRLERMD